MLFFLSQYEQVKIVLRLINSLVINSRPSRQLILSEAPPKFGDGSKSNSHREDSGPSDSHEPASKRRSKFLFGVRLLINLWNPFFPSTGTESHPSAHKLRRADGERGSFSSVSKVAADFLRKKKYWGHLSIFTNLGFAAGNFDCRVGKLENERRVGTARPSRILIPNFHELGGKLLEWCPEVCSALHNEWAELCW